MGTQHVLVAGGGPAGFITALGLAGRYGIKVTLVEAEPQIVNSPRAMVYHWSVLQGLEDLGILQEAMDRGFTKQDYSFVVHRTDERIHWSLDALESVTKHPYNLHLGQNDLAEIACRRLQTNPLASIRFGTKVTDLVQDDHGVTATLHGPEGTTEERFDWVIGADGGGSTVREKILKMNFFGITWPERFVATNVKLPFEAYGYARANMIMDDVYGAIIAKIDRDDLWRVTFMEDAGLPLDTIRDRIHHFYQAYVPGIERDAYDLVQFSPYRMHQRCTDTMRVGRVVLVGDAAHITNPTGGLGLTSGLFDSYFLTEIMNAIVNEGASHDLLNRYSDERRRIFLEIASPQASRNKQRVFHAYEGAWFDRELTQVRRLATDRDAVLAQATFTRQLQSTL
ncbi:FAD-dependent oxidoreductase [Pararhodobacter aggregans]|uniref:FAD-dependent oxidoreductase n=1 Tax=Pararhodobacter aggregans TaxID=404875 RepID=UPI003A8FA2C1